MNLRPEDRGKAAALIIAVVAVFGFIVFRVIASQRAPADAASIQTPAAVAPPIELGGERTMSALGGGVPIEELDSRLAPPAPSAIDPFRKVVTEQTAEQNDDAVAAPASAPAPGTGPGLDQMPGIPPAVPVLPALELIGVIVGGPNFAVVKVGESVSYLREGDIIAPAARLTSITEAGITIRFSGKDHFLPIGSSIGVPGTRSEIG